MDAALSNVLEGARQYFMGLPKQAQSEGSGQPVWPAGAAPPEEGTPAQSGAPASHSRPPSSAAAPPATPIHPPPRPPSEPIEPEPHIIHKATVMREALEKRREQPEPEEDDEESNATLSPPSHIIRKPSAPVPSPAPAPAAPCPSPARPPSIVPEPVTPDHAPVVHVASQAAQTYNSRHIDTYKTPRSQESFGSARLSEPYNTGRPPEPYNVHRPPDPYAANRAPDPYATGRPPDSYTASRPPETYQRYHHYETPPFDGGRTLRGPPSATMPSSARYSPQQTYARISSTMPVQARIREQSANSPPARIPAAVIPSMTPNDRVPPIHHPISSSSGLNRQTLPYSSTHQSRESSSYPRPAAQYDRHTAPVPRKYDPQQSYSGYRPTSSYPPGPRVDPQQMHYRHTAIDNLNPHSSYAARGTSLPYDTSKLPSRSDYSNPIRALDSRNPQDSRGTIDARGSIDSRGSVDSRSSADSRGVVETSTRNVLDTKSLVEQRNIVDTRTNHNYANPTSSNNRYLSNATVPIHQNAALPAKTAYPVPAASKATYDYPMTNNMQTSPARPTAKPGIVNQQARMTVSVTALVNQMNQTKQKRESPLDLSVKTVKNSADSSTAQEELVDSLEADIKILLQQSRPSSTTRQSIPPVPGPAGGPVSSHKVDFAPDFHFQYRDRLNNQNPVAPSNHTSTRYNGALHAEPPRPIPVEQYPVPSRPNVYHDRNRFNSATSAAPKPEYYPRIDLTTTVAEEQHSQIKVLDDRGYAHIERKRSAGAIVSNIPEKMMRYGETWSADSRLDRVNRIDRSAKEQQELMSQPVYSYSSHKRFEAYQNEQKKQALTTPYRSPQVQNESRYAYAPEAPRIPTDYNQHFDRVQPSSGRPVVQKITNHRDVHHHHYHHHHHLEHNNGVPADKRVLSILRNSLEIKQVGLVEPPKQAKEIPDLIVIDDIDDTVIEITDLTKENYGNRLKVISDTKTKRGNSPPAIGSQTIKIPRAVDSIASDFESKNSVSIEKSPEIDVASRIRTKAELKVMPPSEEHTISAETKENTVNNVDKRKQVPKSQKQHLFNQIREDNLRKESTVKTEETTCLLMTDIKSEPMNIEEIEKDAITPLKTDSFLTPTSPDALDLVEDDFDWASACDNFVEQLKTGSHIKKSRKRRNDAEIEIKTEPIIAENYSLDNTRDLAEEKITESDLLPALEHERKVESIKPYDADEINSPFVENIVIKQEPRDEEEIVKLDVPAALHATLEQVPETSKLEKDEVVTIEKRKKKKIQNKNKVNKIIGKRKNREVEKISNIKKNTNKDDKKEKRDTTLSEVKVKQEITKIDSVKIKEEYESTDDDEPLIKSKILKEKEKSDRMKYQLLKDLSEKSAYVKLECCEKANRQSLDSLSTVKEKQQKHKFTRQTSRHKAKSLSSDTINKENKRKSKNTSSDSDSDDVSVACRLRLRKTIKQEDEKIPDSKTAIKPSPIKTQDVNSNSSTTICKPGFGDGSGFHPGWEEELYKYKRSLRMPSKLIAIPRGRSGGPYPKSSAGLFNRGSTSLPDLDPAPLSPAPSSVRSAATDDLYTRLQDKVAVDSDLDSNSSYSAPPKLHYDSEASTSTVFSTTNKKKGSSIVDVLMQKCGKHEDSRRKGKDKIKDENTPKIVPKKIYNSELMAISGSVKSSLSEEKKDKAVDNLNNIKKKTGSLIGDKAIGSLGFTEVIPKSRTRTESRVIKNRVSIKEVFGDDRPASAPPSACRKDEDTDLANVTNCIKKESDEKPKSKLKKQPREKLKKRSNSIREGLRSTMSLKRNDAKGRLLRLKKRNNLLKSLTDKKIKGFTFNKPKKSKSPSPDQKLSEIKAEKSDQLPDGQGKKKFKRLFGRRKFSSGFDYIRKKKKIIRTDGQVIKKVRRPVSKPNPESIHDIQKEIKSWFINKSIGETHLHRAARLGYSDCVAYCLEKMEHDPSAKDNAGFTALHVAAAKGYVFIGRLLLEYGANVSAAAQGGIRPLHEAAENNHIEMIRLLLSYGADPILGTYAGQTPVELAEGKAAILLRLHIADVQGYSLEPWHFPLITKCLDESGCNPLSSPPPATPPPPPDSTIEIQCTDAPLPPFYSLRAAPGQPADGLWCLMQDLTSLLQIKSKDSLLKQIHCGSGSPKELFREIKTPEFLERAQCHQLLCAGEKLNVRASKVALVRVTDKLRQLLKVETVLVS